MGTRLNRAGELIRGDSLLFELSTSYFRRHLVASSYPDGLLGLYVADIGPHGSYSRGPWAKKHRISVDVRLKFVERRDIAATLRTENTQIG